MASSKLSALTAITSAGDDDLIYVADTADGGNFASIAADDYSTVTTGISSFNGAAVQIDALTEAQKTALRYDPDLLAGGPNKLTTDDVVGLDLFFADAGNIDSTFLSDKLKFES